MKVLYFDCFSGVSGDMMLGTLLDLGVNQEAFIEELDKLNLDGYEVVIEKKVKNAIRVTDVDIIIEKHHSHHHGDAVHHHHRNLTDIEKIIDDSLLKSSIKDFAKRVFKEIAKAEGKVHNKSINEIHFHEVGAIDSIVDIVGVSICIDLLGVDKVYSSPLHDGTGFISCQHGMLPVPVPAVMEMLEDSKIPYVIENINTELVTPTGLALIKCLACEYGVMPPMVVDKVGYGAGKRDTGRFNALRGVVGTLVHKSNNDEEVIVIETNIDDMNSEILGFVMEKLLMNGALDVFYTPIYMKKNRPGVMLTVLSDAEREDELSKIILSETSTLGIRKFISKRQVLKREEKKVDTKYGEIRVKVSYTGEFIKTSPEYEDCKKAALENKIPIHRVYDEAKNAL
ncbi:UNVERIFIED_CONTAM: hypothetical protein Cloal_3922 [Acetivibrio alkalicellulosi]